MIALILPPRPLRMKGREKKQKIDCVSSTVGLPMEIAPAFQASLPNIDSATAYRFPGLGSGQLYWSALQTVAMRACAEMSGRVSEDWLMNHHRWLVWKLAYLQRLHAGRTIFSLRNLISGLVSRFRKEYDARGGGRVGVVRRLLQGNCSSELHMVLCISGIDVGQKMVELTDGWYSLWALLDAPLFSQLSRDRLFTGLRLRLWGCTFTSSDADRSDSGSAGVLCLHANGVRRVGISHRLGAARHQGFRVHLDSLVADGGKAPCVHVRVERAFGPLAYARRSGRWFTRGGFAAYQRRRLLARDMQEDESFVALGEKNNFDTGDGEEDNFSWAVRLQVSDIDGGNLTHTSVWLDSDGEHVDQLMKEGGAWKIYAAELMLNTTDNSRSLFARASFWRSFTSIKPLSAEFVRRQRECLSLSHLRFLPTYAECDIVGILVLAAAAQNLGDNRMLRCFFVTNASATELLCVRWEYDALEPLPPIVVGHPIAIINGRMEDHSYLRGAGLGVVGAGAGGTELATVRVYLMRANSLAPHAALVTARVDSASMHLGSTFEALTACVASHQRAHAKMAAIATALLVGELTPHTIASLVDSPPPAFDVPTAARKMLEILKNAEVEGISEISLYSSLMPDNHADDASTRCTLQEALESLQADGSVYQGRNGRYYCL